MDKEAFMNWKTGLPALGIVASLAGSAPSPVSAAPPLERLVAFAVDTSEIAGRTRAGMVEIAIERWSTDEERGRLESALTQGGPEALLRAVQKVDQRVGFIRSAGGLGYPLRFAYQIPQPGGGRRIVVATDRPISFFESRYRPRTVDYPFLVVDIRLDAGRDGEGELLPLAKIIARNDTVIEIENYASVPVRLTKVRQEQP